MRLSVYTGELAFEGANFVRLGDSRLEGASREQHSNGQVVAGWPLESGGRRQRPR